MRALERPIPLLHALRALGAAHGTTLTSTAPAVAGHSAGGRAAAAAATGLPPVAGDRGMATEAGVAQAQPRLLEIREYTLHPSGEHAADGIDIRISGGPQPACFKWLRARH